MVENALGEKYVGKLIFHLAEYEFKYCIDHAKECELCADIVRLDAIGFYDEDKTKA